MEDGVTNADDLLGLLAKLNRTIDTQQQQIDQLQAQNQALTAELQKANQSGDPVAPPVSDPTTLPTAGSGAAAQP
jgi:Tfp pilus assembly protein PilN